MDVQLRVLAHVGGPLHACHDAIRIIKARLDCTDSLGKLTFGKVLQKGMLLCAKNTRLNETHT